MQGQTTIDVERKKAYFKLLVSLKRRNVRRNRGNMPSPDAEEQQKLRRLKPTTYFRIPKNLLGDIATAAQSEERRAEEAQLEEPVEDSSDLVLLHEAIVVPTLLHENPYDQGDAWSNLRFVLGYVSGRLRLTCTASLLRCSANTRWVLFLPMLMSAFHPCRLAGPANEDGAWPLNPEVGHQLRARAAQLLRKSR